MTEDKLRLINRVSNELSRLKEFLNDGCVTHGVFTIETSASRGPIGSKVSIECSPEVKGELINIINNRIELLTKEFEAL